MAEPRIRCEGVVYLKDSGERHPMSVVWTTLPGISVLLPVIGHMGIADSTGVTFDFSGPYQVRLAQNYQPSLPTQSSNYTHQKHTQNGGH